MEWTLVTGGSKRLGSIICKSLAKDGHNIVIHYNTSEESATKIAQECRKYGVQIEMIQGDFSSTDNVKAFTKKYLSQFPETLNLVNNVGNFIVKSFLKTSIEEMLDLYQTNFFAPYVLIQELLPSIKKLHGNIINIGCTGVTSIKSDLYASAYTLTKSSLLLLTKSLAQEFSEHNVRVNMVSPGYLDIAIDLPSDTSILPMKRAGKCEEISNVVQFLLNKDNSYITGQNIEVSGGLNL